MNETITWIDCAERLPNSHGTVLVFVPDEQGVEIGYFDGQMWRNYYSDLHSRLYGVTHWAEMPAGPGATR